MKTKDFIKMLQDADPSGELHIRFRGDSVLRVPIAVYKMDGYYDGGYSYIDDEGNFVYTNRNDKVDIYYTDIFDFVELNLKENTTYEEILSKFKFDSDLNEQDKEKILNEIKEAYKIIRTLDKKNHQIFL